MSLVELIGLGTAFVVTLVATRVVELVARRKMVYDRVSSRSAHTRPTPRLGGAAIALGVLAGTLVALPNLDWRYLVLLFGGAIVLVVGIYDDLASLPVLPRLLVQTAVASGTAVLWQPSVDLDFALIAFRLDGPAAVVLMAIWLVALMNVFNFMDGIDGMVAGVTIVAVPALLVVTGGAMSSPLLIAVGAACLGFLIWNQHPASIFMGDGGSYLLGYLVGASVFIQEDVGVPLVPAAIVLGLFMIDTAGTLLQRAKARANLLTAHSDHLYQRLVRRDYHHRAVAALYMVGTGLAGVAGAWYLDGAPFVQVVILAVGMAAVAAYFLATQFDG